MISDEHLLLALQGRGWTTAEAIQRSIREPGDPYGVNAPSVTKVGRHLSRLAREGKCVKSHGDGSGKYRALTDG